MNLGSIFKRKTPEVHEHQWEPQEGLVWLDSIMEGRKLPLRIYQCHCGKLKHEHLDLSK